MTRWMSTFTAALLLCTGSEPSSADANTLFNPVLPSLKSADDHYASKPACAGAQPGIIESFFGLSFREPAQLPGRYVSAVDPKGPAAGKIFPGDLIVSVNGDLLVQDNSPYGGGILVAQLDENYVERGIYVWGMRNNQPFQDIIWSCAGAPVPELFSKPSAGPYLRWTLNDLWPEQPNGHTAPALDMRLIVAGLTRVHNMAFSSFARQFPKHPLAPELDEYCLRPDMVEFPYKVMRKRWDQDNFGNRSNERSETFEVKIQIDRQLYGAYTSNFDLIHNEMDEEVAALRDSLRRTIEEFGCASPEFKDFERRVFLRMGAVW